MSDIDDLDNSTHDDPAMFGKGGSGKGSSGSPQGRWVTILGHKTFIVNGKVTKGGLPGTTHHHETGSPLAKHTGRTTAPAKEPKARAEPKAEPKPAKLKPEPKPKTIKERVAKTHAETSHAKVHRATEGLHQLKSGTHAGDTHKHIDKVARGATKGELFDAAHSAGIKHGAKTKKELVEHLKNEHGHDGQPRATEKSVAPAPREVATPESVKVAHKPEPEKPERKTESKPEHKPNAAKPSTPEHSRATFNAKESQLSQKDAEAHASKILGKDVKFHEIASMVGAPHDAKVHFETTYGGGLAVKTDGPGYYSVRHFQKDSAGKPYIKNEFSEVTNAGKGTGREVFANQVAHASAHGVDRIEMVAAGSFNSDGSANLVGYKVWPKFGFDAPIDPDTKGRLPGNLRRAKNVSDLMKTPEGQAAWAKHGGGFKATFDLKAGSPSHKIWNAYRAAKAAKGGE